MTTRHEDEPEHPAAALVQTEAQWLVQTLCDALAAKGWDCVIVSVTRRVDIDAENVMAPGATALHCDRARMQPALGTNAQALRKVADQLDEMTDTRGVVDVSGYVHDQSHPGHGQWPR